MTSFKDVLQCTYEQATIARDLLNNLLALMEQDNETVEGLSIREHLLNADFAIGSALQSLDDDDSPKPSPQPSRWVLQTYFQGSNQLEQRGYSREFDSREAAEEYARQNVTGSRYTITEVKETSK